MNLLQQKNARRKIEIIKIAQFFRQGHQKS